MSIIDTLITDRTEADKARVLQLNAKGWAAMTAEEQALYLSDQLKGAYTVHDLTRVETACVYLAERINAAGVAVSVTPHEWEDKDFTINSQLASYRQNIVALRAALAVLPGTAEVPGSIPALTVQEANDIESILLSIDKALDNIAAAHRHCGVTITGLGGIRI